MGRKDKNKKKGLGAEKTAMKTDKKLAAKHKKMLQELGETDIAELVKELQDKEKKLQKVTEEICQQAPSPRSYFSLVTHPEKEELILFGGEFFNGKNVSIYNDLYFYNISKKEWRIIKCPGGPTARSGHQMVAVANDGGQLWLFGGEYASPSQMQFHHFNDLWMFSLKNKRWEKITSPNGPSPRSGHRMVASKKRLYIFGGFRDNFQSSNYFNDIHIFSLETYEWLKIEIAGAVSPSPRSGCCISPCPDGSVLVWGGYCKTKTKKDGEVGKTHTDMFALVADKNDSNKFKWNQVKPKGYKPPPCSSVGFCNAPNGKVFCFGGVIDVDENEEDLKGQCCNDLFTLDLSSLNWNLIEVKKKTKSTKKELENNEMAEVEMSEVAKPFTNTTDDGVFTVTVAGPSSSSTSGNVPSNKESVFSPHPRMNPAMTVCKGTLYMFGGLYEELDKQLTFNDFYALDLHKLEEWNVLIPNNKDSQEWLGSDSESGSDDESDSDDTDMDDEDDSDSEMDTE